MTVAFLFRCAMLSAALWAPWNSRGFGAVSHPTGADEFVAHPLAARSGPPGRTMFVELPAAQTGVVTENAYADPKMWMEHYQEYSVGAVGTGVAIGDYDNDGRPDLFAVNKTGPCRLFRNLGAWKFEDVTTQAGLGGSAGGGWRSFIGLDDGGGDSVENWKQGAAFADINNDGWLDLYVCRFGAPNWLFVNQGNGTFKEEAAKRGLAVVDGSCMGAFCDFDRDGWLDVYLQTNLLNFAAQPTGRPDYLFRNNGDGTFADVTARAGITGDTQGHSATWWDYDNDGWPDIYAANDFAAPDALYHNNRDGTFTNVAGRVLPHTPYSAMGADLGDINNDGLIDFLVADMAATTHEKDQRGMADSRARTKDHPENSPAAPQVLRNALFLNTGVGVCQEAAFLAGLAHTDWTWSTRWEDLDNDGRLDLHVTNGMTREFHNSDFIQRVMLTESLTERMRIPRSSPELKENNLAFRNLGDLRFESVGPGWGLDQFGVSFGAAFGDLDGDGDLDLVYSNHDAGVTLLRNDSDTGRRLIVALRGTRSNRFGVGATVRVETTSGTQVRQLVLARGYLSTSEPVLHFGLGADERISQLSVHWPSGHMQNLSGIAADQRLTITEPDSPATPEVTKRADSPAGQFMMFDSATNLALTAREETIEETNQQPLLPFRFNRRGPALAVGDLNGDGHDDVLLGGTTRQPAQIRLGGASAAFADGGFSLFPESARLDDGPLLVFDANGDGRDDLLQTKASTAVSTGAPEFQPRLWLNDGRGSVQLAAPDALPAFPLSAGAATAADFDRDGRLDVFIGARVQSGRYPRAPRSVLLANRGGKFEDITDTGAPGLREVGLVTSALWSDADGDGWLDLLIATEWGGVRWWRNDAGRGLVDRSTAGGFVAAGTGWWTSLATADFNHDGRPDYVAGNVGLNTQYRASPEQPALIFSGDFRGGGAPLLVEAYYEGDRLYPRRTRKDLGAHVAAILRRYPQNDAYGRATLEEIFSADSLAKAQRFAATELRSGVFLSQPNGTWQFAPLPRVAQIAPMQGVVAGDFDGDGHADIVAMQNSFAPIPHIGRFDGGLGQFLRGDGQGRFIAVPPTESGLVVAGDAKAVVVLDLDRDNWPDFLVSQNNGPVLSWRNAGVPGRNSLRVVLRGPVGNPRAIGARLTFVVVGGPEQTLEVGAGSGYYSQSTMDVFFGYAAAAVPRVLRVRWPSGATSEALVRREAGMMTLSAP